MNPADLSDAELLERFREDRSEAAFEELVRRHHGLVLGVTRRILGNSGEAEDAAQAVFIALALRSDRVKAFEAGLAPWLHVVAVRAALGVKKSAARRQHRVEVVGRMLAEAARPADTGLDEAIESLPGILRRATIAHYFLGLSVAEIAQNEGENPNTISMRLARAREKLRKRLRTTGSAIVAAMGGSLLSSYASVELVAATARNATRALSAARFTEPALLTLLRIARRAAAPPLAQMLAPALAVTFLAALAFPIATIVGKTSPSAAPPDGDAASPLHTAVVATATPPAPPVKDPALINAVKTLRSFEEARDFERLLSRSGAIDAIRDSHGRTALHWAITTNQMDFTALLLKRGASANAGDIDGWTPLMYAVKEHDNILMLLLILGGADVNHVAKDGATPLGIATKAGDFTDAEALLWTGANPEPANVEPGWQPRALAASKPALRHLLDDYVALRAAPGSQPVPMPAFVHNPLHRAAARGDYPALEAYIQSGGPNVRDEKGRTPIFDAINAGQPEVVFYLLMMGADPNATDFSGATPLDQTVRWQGYDLDLMQYGLFVKGANPNALRNDGHSELTWAALRGNGGTVQFLLWMKVDPWQQTVHGTAFEVAAREGNQPILDLLRHYGIDEPIRLDGDANWRLRQAAKLGDLDGIEAALRAGANINSGDENGNPAVFLAVYKKNVPAARLLLKHGASVNSINSKNGVSLLIATTGWDFPEMTAFREDILKAGADVNYRKPSDGRSALMAALGRSPGTTMRQLIKHGADINAHDAKGRSVLGRAIDDNQMETVDYLRKLGSKE